MKKIILASSSPRRQAMCTDAGLDFQVVVSPAEELHDVQMPLDQLCETNARLKAAAVSKDYPYSLVIGADTLVYVDQTPLGKPRDLDHARMMLRRLSNQVSQVCTGVCLAEGEKRYCFHVITDVVFKDLTDDVIADYMSKVDVMDKAGSYAVQEYGDLIIEEVIGDYDNVVGLPMTRLLQEISELV